MIRTLLLAFLAICGAHYAAAASTVDCPAATPGYLDVSPQAWPGAVNYYDRLTITVGGFSFDPQSVDIQVHGYDIDVTLSGTSIDFLPPGPRCISASINPLSPGHYSVSLKLNDASFSPPSLRTIMQMGLLVLGLPRGNTNYSCTTPQYPDATLAVSPTVPDSSQALMVAVGITQYMTYAAQIDRDGNTIDITVDGEVNMFTALPQFCTGLPLGPLPSGMYTLKLSSVSFGDPASKRLVKTVTFEVAGPPAELSGLWWSAGESGWGISITQRGSNVFAVWYTYDAAGNPKWYVAPHCELRSASAMGHCVETLYEVNGPRFFGSPFNPAAAQISGVGAIDLTFGDENTGSMMYTVAGQTRTVAIGRQPISSGATLPPVNYTDLWWNPDESGWGMAVSHQYGVMFLTWFVYDSAGKPVWFVASNCNVKASQDGCDGTLYRTAGPAFGPTFDSSKVSATAVGSVSLTFPDSNNGSLSYTVDGVSSAKVIKRQVF